MLTHSKLLACVAIASFVSLSCAAMQRTWDFNPAARGNQLVEPRIEFAKVSRAVVVVDLALVNRTATPAELELGRTMLSLPDGTTIQGNADLVELTQSGALSLLEDFGFKKSQDSRVGPGETRTFELVFRHSRKDLRRFPWMTIDLGTASVDGAYAGLPALVLTAPADAPMGEDI
jgi:hypothetical protein